MLIWLIVWPLVTGMQVLLGFAADDLPLGIQTLLLTSVLVPLISLLIAPMMQRLATHLMKNKP